MELFQRNGQWDLFAHFTRRRRGIPLILIIIEPITLLSCFGKLFTAVLNERLTSYFEENHLIWEEQAGFRHGHSTLDHIFVLHSLIDLYLSKRERVYCAFIDYKKAFDLVNRTSLWSILLKNNVDGNFFRVINHM